MATDGQNDAPVTDPPNSPVEGTPPPVAEPAKEDSPKGDNTHELIAELSSKVDALAAQVTALTEPHEQDSTPVKPPWTHRKVF